MVFLTVEAEYFGGLLDTLVYGYQQLHAYLYGWEWSLYWRWWWSPLDRLPGGWFFIRNLYLNAVVIGLLALGWWLVLRRNPHGS